MNDGLTQMAAEAAEQRRNGCMSAALSMASVLQAQSPALVCGFCGDLRELARTVQMFSPATLSPALPREGGSK